MGVRFDAAARRSILAATIEAEKHGRTRPIPVDLLAGFLAISDGFDAPATPADARAVLASSRAARAFASESPDASERILQRAAELAGNRASAEVGLGDIVNALLELLPTGSLRSPPGAAAASDAEPASRVGDQPDTAAAEWPRTGSSRAGVGYDSHRFGDRGPLILGGITIPDAPRLIGHSDGDAIAHAITDAVLGAAGAGDIGEMFSDTDAANRGRNSIEMLAAAVQRVEQLGLRVCNVDVTVIAEQPKLAPHRGAIREVLARALRVSPSEVSVKGKTNEGMGWIGRGEGLACIAVATLVHDATR
jgi:2-C-methyl-D-erythritol 2,4-cyclodiphosphate synthase